MRIAVVALLALAFGCGGRVEGMSSSDAGGAAPTSGGPAAAGSGASSDSEAPCGPSCTLVVETIEQEDIEFDDWASPRFERLWGASSDDIWGVGTIGSKGGPMPKVCRFNGKKWTCDSPSEPVGSVWGLSSTEVLVGGYGLRFWDGSAWQTWTMPAELSELEIGQIAGTSLNDLWLVSEWEAPLRHFDGRRLRTGDLPFIVREVSVEGVPRVA